jgi:hypothetical protein
MPTTITIGEKFWNTETSAWDVERDNAPDAPVFENDETLEPLSNWRYINLRVWRSMAEVCGISGWLSPLLKSSDVIHALTAEDYRIINEAYLLRSAFREGEPGWGDEGDEYLARLIWLRFWIRRALDHGEHPSLVVSW